MNQEGKFIPQSLPMDAQYSVVNSIIPYDFYRDGINEYILAGNKYGAEVETVRYDASHGIILKWDTESHPVFT